MASSAPTMTSSASACVSAHAAIDRVYATRTWIMVTKRQSTRRDAFTLIELLVVIALILLLVGLTVMFILRVVTGWSAEGRGTSQQSLQIAKARAISGRLPYGMRLKPDANNLVHEIYFIEQPADFVPRDT